MREKLRNIYIFRLVIGITPACAGKTTSFFLKFAGFWDHPRVCGKNKPTKFTEPQAAGSPPRVREKPALSASSALPARITPACAGKTEYDEVLKEITRDHPRVCGKNSLMRSKKGIERGSPPRVREKLDSQINQFT